MWLFEDYGRRGPSGGPIPSPLPNHCDLALFGELGNTDRSVLIIKMRLQFRFRKTIDENGVTYDWTRDEKKKLAEESKTAIVQAWDNRFRIKTTSTVPDKAFRNVGVRFDLSILIDGLHIFEDYEFEIRKVGPVDRDDSEVFPKDRTGKLDNRTALPRIQMTTDKGINIYQKPVVHEFGHLLGLRDEYHKNKNIPHFTRYENDPNSVMHSGGAIRPRHYVPFARWLTEKFASKSRRAGVDTLFQVDSGDGRGMFDQTNTYLG